MRKLLLLPVVLLAGCLTSLNEDFPTQNPLHPDSVCHDGTKNFGETDVDCGGAYCDPCADTRACDAGLDCASGVCTGGVCQAPSCGDGVKNGPETAVDCGGGCDGCRDGSACAVPADCASGVCDELVCTSCSDHLQNGDETDVDCGGSCVHCADRKACAVPDDCLSGSCDGTVCTSCRDGVQDGDETGVDCGGSCFPSCEGEIVVYSDAVSSLDENIGEPAVAMRANGSFMVVWQDDASSTSAADRVWARAYDAEGAALGDASETITSFQDDSQLHPSVVAGSGTDDWWVAYQSKSNVVIRKRTATGTYATVTQLNTNTVATYPKLVAGLSGAFRAVWQRNDIGFIANEVRTCSVSSGGTPGGDTLVNASTYGEHSTPAVASSSTGAYVIVWQQADADGTGIYARCYDAGGVAGTEFLVNGTTAGEQTRPAVAMNGSEAVVVAWLSDGAIMGRTYATCGVEPSAEFRLDEPVLPLSAVLTDGTSDPAWWCGAPSVSLTDDGTIRAVWPRGYDYSAKEVLGTSDIRFRRFSLAGAALSREAVVAGDMSRSVTWPRIASLPGGSSVIVWDGYESGVQSISARRAP